MSDPLDLSCPYCGEFAEVEPDEDGGSPQSFVQDCAVCCRPWQVEAVQSPDGTWEVTLRTEDE